MTNFDSGKNMIFMTHLIDLKKTKKNNVSAGTGKLFS